MIGHVHGRLGRIGVDIDMIFLNGPNGLQDRNLAYF